MTVSPQSTRRKAAGWLPPGWYIHAQIDRRRDHSPDGWVLTVTVCLQGTGRSGAVLWCAHITGTSGPRAVAQVAGVAAAAAAAAVAVAAVAAATC